MAAPAPATASRRATSSSVSDCSESSCTLRADLGGIVPAPEAIAISWRSDMPAGVDFVISAGADEDHLAKVIEAETAGGEQELTDHQLDAKLLELRLSERVGESVLAESNSVVAPPGGGAGGTGGDGGVGGSGGDGGSGDGGDGGDGGTGGSGGDGGTGGTGGTQSDQVDRFGVQMIYPSKAGGESWFLAD